MLSAIWHVAFHVAGLERSIAFYTTLGMRLVHRQDQANAYTSSLVGYPDASLRIAQLALPNRTTQAISSHDLELVEYRHPRRISEALERCMPGTGHLAFATDDMDAEYARLTHAGVQFVSEPNTITDGVNRGGAACYFLDPDDITLELVQPPTRTEQPS